MGLEIISIFSTCSALVMSAERCQPDLNHVILSGKAWGFVNAKVSDMVWVQSQLLLLSNYKVAIPFDSSSLLHAFQYPFSISMALHKSPR
jgi:hypothetical protein